MSAKRAQEDFRTTAPDLRRHRGRRRRHQPPVLPADDQLRPAVEPHAPGAAPWPHSPHRPGARCPRLQLRRHRVRGGPAIIEGRILHGCWRNWTRCAPCWPTVSSMSSAKCFRSTTSTCRRCCAKRPMTHGVWRIPRPDRDGGPATARSNTRRPRASPWPVPTWIFPASSAPTSRPKSAASCRATSRTSSSSHAPKSA